MTVAFQLLRDANVETLRHVVIGSTDKLSLEHVEAGVIVTLFGGAGTFFGPFVGAGTYLGDRLAVLTERWRLHPSPYDCPRGRPGWEVPVHYVPSIEPVPPA